MTSVRNMSTAGDTDSVFSDAEMEPREDVSKRKREREGSVTDIVSAYEKKQRKGKSPKSKTAEKTASCDKIPPEMLSCIREVIQSTIQTAIRDQLSHITSVMEKKITSQQKSIDILEKDLFEKTEAVEKLEKTLENTKQEMCYLSYQVDEMERHQRGVNLVLSSKRFGASRQGEDVREEAVRVLNDSLPDTTRVAPDSFSAAHRLGRENTVIVAFHDRNLRNQVYKQRLQLRTTNSLDRRLFITESLTRFNRELFNELLTMKSKKLLWTAFTNNGLPAYKLTRDSNPVRVTTVRQVQQLWQQVKALRRRNAEGEAPPAAAAPGRSPVQPHRDAVPPAAGADASSGHRDVLPGLGGLSLGAQPPIISSGATADGTTRPYQGRGSIFETSPAGLPLVSVSSASSSATAVRSSAVESGASRDPGEMDFGTAPGTGVR